MTELLVLGAITLVVVPIFLGLVVYALALYQICFTFVREGTAIFIMKGETFDHVIMSWSNHYLNDPRRKAPWYNPAIPAWEVLQVGGNYEINGSKTNTIPAMAEMPRRKLYSPLRLLERYGIHFYGLWPFKEVHEYDFEWTEEKVLADGTHQPSHRDEPTRIMFVASFPYWVRLVDAEDMNNLPISLDYLLTTRVNNPYKARFTVTDWLERLTADSNNQAKKWVGRKDYAQIIQERANPPAVGSAGPATADAGTFVDALTVLNTNLPTEHADRGAPVVIGVTVVASSLQQVIIGGRDPAAIQTATTAKEVARLTAEATVATAEGDKKAEVLRAEGRQQAIELVYRKVNEFGDLGRLLSQLDAMQAPGQGEKIIWANNPFVGNAGLGTELERLGISPQMFADGLRRIAGSNPPAQQP